MESSWCTKQVVWIGGPICVIDVWWSQCGKE